MSFLDKLKHRFFQEMHNNIGLYSCDEGHLFPWGKERGVLHSVVAFEKHDVHITLWHIN